MTNNLLGDRRLTAAIFLALAVVVMILSGRTFRQMFEPDLIVEGPGVTGKAKLSKYLSTLKDTPSDTDVYYLKGKEPGAKFLVMAGAHNDEVAAQVAAIVLLENAVVTKGELIIIPRMNNSGATHTEVMEAHPQFLEIKTRSGGVRKIRTGSRYLNPAHQFPDPEVYVHVTSGQKTPGSESRNLNRVHPGRPRGTLLERVSYAVVQLINQEKVDLTLDLHQAIPEHYVDNCMVGHQRAMELVTIALMSLKAQGISIKMFASPRGVSGLSHRGIGDATQTYMVLAESNQMMITKFRGKTTHQLLLEGKDPFYDILFRKGKLFIDYDSKKGSPIKEGVGRHLSTVMELTRALTEVDETKVIEIEGVPEYMDMMENGLGYYLKSPEKT